MPYIPDHKRRKQLDPMGTGVPRKPGELNYAITALLREYVKLKGESYDAYNDCTGALVNALLEWYRRKPAPYEDTKIIENGDIYGTTN